MTEPCAKVILDSVSPDGHRLTTMEIVMHRFVLAEFNTHRVFSRNSASSRAIPFTKQLARVRTDPAIPVSFPSEQPGMQGGAELTEDAREDAIQQWLFARDSAVIEARRLWHLGVHKSVVNRILEPFMWHTVIVSSTEWDNFFGQRCNPLAQPEIQMTAYAMQSAYDQSVPTPLGLGEWHMPYLLPDEISLRLGDAKRISAARCARVSYLTHDGVRDHAKDIELCERLLSASPPHASPLEHVATPESDPYGDDPPHRGNFTGWRQFRHEMLDV